MPYLNEKYKQKDLLLLKEMEIHSIKQKCNSPAVLQGNNDIPASCLMCNNPRCIRYATEEIEIPAPFTEFSYERNYDVCPFSAIYFDDAVGIISINEEKCVNCGLCANRCPIGAIYFDGKHTVINCEENDAYIKVPMCKENVDIQQEQINTMLLQGREERYAKTSEKHLSTIIDVVKKCDGRSLIQNILIRNTFLALGYKCAISRMGDVYTRMDAVYVKDDCYGVIEIEFGKDTLEASRAIMDDIAVLHARNSILKEHNLPVVVCLTLPNKRQGYFQVVKDIDKVLDIQIQTITLGALLMAMWNGSDVDFGKKLFYADFDNMSIRDAMEMVLNKDIDIDEGCMGMLEPEK